MVKYRLISGETSAIGTLITTGSLGAGFAPGLIAVVVFAAILVYLCMRTQKDLKSEYALSGAKS